MPRALKWTSRMVAALGRSTDAEVAKKFGISEISVWKMRKKLEIKAFFPAKSAKNVWQDHELALGVLDDTCLAKKLGLHPTSVHKARLRRGVPPKNPQLALRYEWPPSAIKKLGKMSDRAVAEFVGCTPQAVLQMRRKLGIDAYRKHSHGGPK